MDGWMCTTTPQKNQSTAQPLDVTCSTHLHLSPTTHEQACGHRLEEVEARGSQGEEGHGGVPPEEGEEEQRVSAYYHFDSRWVGGC